MPKRAPPIYPLRLQPAHGIPSLTPPSLWWPAARPWRTSPLGWNRTGAPAAFAAAWSEPARPRIY